MTDSGGMDHLLGQVISDAGLKQLRLAETQKFKHVTSFFNGKQDDRKEFWNNILNKITDIDITLFGSYLCMIRVKNNMFLESSIYTYPCYIFTDFFNKQISFNIIAKSLQTIVKRNASNDPEPTIKALSCYQDKEPQKVNHNMDWQDKMSAFIR